MINQTG